MEPGNRRSLYITTLRSICDLAVGSLSEFTIISSACFLSIHLVCVRNVVNVNGLSSSELVVYPESSTLGQLLMIKPLYIAGLRFRSLTVQ